MVGNFIERNKSVFVIGVLTLMIFMSIIVISEVRRVRKGNDSPKLVRVENDSVPTIDSVEEETSSTNVWDSIFSAVDIKYGTILIEYTNKGFVPKYAKAILGQKVKWSNKTNTDVYVTQKTVFFDEFKTPLLLPANGTAEFRLYKDGMWDYKSSDNGLEGNIEIVKP